MGKKRNSVIVLPRGQKKYESVVMPSRGKRKECPECHGNRRVPRSNSDGNRYYITCPACDGSGWK